MSSASRAVLLRRLLLSASLGAVACGGATTDTTDSTDGATAGAAGTAGASGASQGDGGAGESAGGTGGAGGEAGAATGGAGAGGASGGGAGVGGAGTGGAGSAGKGGGPGMAGSSNGPGSCSHSTKCIALADVGKSLKVPSSEPLTACPAAGEMSTGLCFWYAALTSTENDTCCYDYVSGGCCGRPLLTDEGPRVARLAHRADWA